MRVESAADVPAEMLLSSTQGVQSGACVKRSFYDRGVGYDWLPEALAALVGVEPHEAAQVLAARRRLPLAAVSGGVRFIAIMGRTQAGRPLVVAVRKAGEFNQQIIGAREMTPAELKRFEAWEVVR